MAWSPTTQRRFYQNQAPTPALMQAFYGQRANQMARDDAQERFDFEKAQAQQGVAEANRSFELAQKNAEMNRNLGLGSLAVQAYPHLKEQLFGGAASPGGTNLAGSGAAAGRAASGVAPDAAAPPATGGLMSRVSPGLGTVAGGALGYMAGKPLARILTGKEGGWVERDVAPYAGAALGALAGNTMAGGTAVKTGLDWLGSGARAVGSWLSKLW